MLTTSKQIPDALDPESKAVMERISQELETPKMKALLQLSLDRAMLQVNRAKEPVAKWEGSDEENT